MTWVAPLDLLMCYHMKVFLRYLWLTEVHGDIGFQGRLCLGRLTEELSVPVGALGTLWTVHLVWRRVLADSAVTGRWGPQRWAWHRLTPTQEGVEEVVACLFGRLQHLMGKNPWMLSLVCLREMIMWREMGLSRKHKETDKDLQSMPRINYMHLFAVCMRDITDPTLSRTLGPWIGQLWWLPWCSASSCRRIPSFWSNSQSSSSMPSQPWNEIMTFNDNTPDYVCLPQLGTGVLLATIHHNPPWTNCTVHVPLISIEICGKSVWKLA